MKKQKLPNEYADSYSTGEVQPPKGHRGLITVLLLLVIFLGGLVSALSFWGIQLFQQLQAQENASVSFIADMRLSEEEEAENENLFQVPDLGIEGYFLSAFDRRYFNMPPGFYITAVEDPLSGLRPGDLLIKVDNTQITDAGALFSALGAHGPGAMLSLDVYRNGAHRNISANLQ